MNEVGGRPASPASGAPLPSSARPTAQSATSPGVRGAGAAVNSRSAGLVLLVVLTVVWGTHWAVVKIGLQTMPPLTYATLRVALGLATVLGVLAAQGKLRRLPRGDVSIVLSVGIGQVAAGVLIMNLALQAVAAGRSSVLVYTMPLWVALVLLAAYRVRPRRSELAGLVLGIGGLALLLNPAVIDWGNAGELAGSSALLVNAVLWAGVTIHVRRHHWILSPLELQPWQLLVALVPIAIVAFLVEGFRGVDWHASTVFALLYSAPLATAFGFWASQAVTRALGAQASATGFLAVPVVGLAAGSVLLGESLGPVDLLGFALVLAGVAVTSLWPRRG